MDKVDVAVIGAGPAGLGAALGARRGGAKSVLVVERQKEAGLTRKGEILHHSGTLANALGAGIYERHAVSQVSQARFRSPSECRAFQKDARPGYVIDFHTFVKEIADTARKEDIRIETETVVEEVRMEGGVARGLVLKQGSERREVRCQTVIGAGGTGCPTMQHTDLDRSRIDCPILKMEYEEANVEEVRRIEFWIDAGEDVPPAVSFVFPRGPRSAEVGYVVFADCTRNGQLPEPGPALERAFEASVKRHPTLARTLDGAERTLRTFHKIPMGGAARDEVPHPGLLTAGDRTAHITAGGGSGVNASLHMGLMIGGLAGELAAQQTAWSPAVARQVRRRIDGNRIRRKLTREFWMVRPFRTFAYNLLGTPKSIDRAWPLIALCLRTI